MRSDRAKRKVELPLNDPIFGTYHHQGSGAAILSSNPSVRNWYLNEAVLLRCTKKFLYGFTSPQININKSAWSDNPYLEKERYGMRFTKGYINLIIKELLDNGFYVHFGKVDDYYVEGKSWYQEKHNGHDGLICGYDDEAGTYTIYAYDTKWIYRTFKTPQQAFNAGRLAMQKQGVYGGVCGMKPKSEQVTFDPGKVCRRLQAYLGCSKEDLLGDDNTVNGIDVLDYIAVYVDKLYEGTIPYERMDRRVFRVIWEHRRAMLERLQKAETTLGLDPTTSKAYESLVTEANTMRMLYAAHHMKRRDSALPILRKKLVEQKGTEQDILWKFLKKVESEVNG